jgi:ribonucleotide reductase beta subunit family protein with ferritin-like domain
MATSRTDEHNEVDHTTGILGTGLRDGLQLKPIRYQWAYDLYNQAVANTWFPNEVQLVRDLADFEKLTDDEKHALKTVISYLNPNELLINKSLAFGIYPYINAAEAHIYLSKQMWEEANHCMSFEYILETFPVDREKIYAQHVDHPAIAAKEEFEVKFIKRMDFWFWPSVLVFFRRTRTILFIKVPAITDGIIAVHQHIQSFALEAIEIFHLQRFTTLEEILIDIWMTEKLIRLNRLNT